MSPKLIALWKKMSDLTAPECASVCRIPHSCCAPEYCDMAEERAAENGITLAPTGHLTLKFMGPEGCVVAPHLRPLCTLHTCAINDVGFKHEDLRWTLKYFNLRAAIEEEEGMDL